MGKKQYPASSLVAESEYCAALHTTILGELRVDVVADMRRVDPSGVSFMIGVSAPSSKRGKGKDRMLQTRGRCGSARRQALVSLVAVTLMPMACGGGHARGGQPAVVSATDAAQVSTLCETGREHLERREYGLAAEWLDRCIEADPARAYPHYQAGMAYREINRIDLMTIRLERFLELAPEAPERPRVEAILQTARGR